MSWGVNHVDYSFYYPEAPDTCAIPPRLPAVGDLLYLMRHGRGSYMPLRVHSIDEKGIISLENFDLGPNHFIAVAIGDWGRSWRFTGDPAVKPLTKLEIQLADIRVRRREYGGEWMPEKFQESRVPSCDNCGEWPCERLEGCPDYATLAGRPKYK